ncbi:MAG: hypothetical protein JWN58_2351, partial [Gammaproteobacteria bacterium]|nr:hypothetical protein [Gammaproteobacteria bacterium]
DFADIYIIEAYSGLVRLQAFGFGKSNLDRCAQVKFLENDDETTDQHHERREYPNQGQSTPRSARGHCIR